MTDDLLNLSDADLREITQVLRSGRLQPPYTAIALERVIGSPLAAGVGARLQELGHLGFSPVLLAKTIELIIEARTRRIAAEDLIELVTSGPEAPGINNRDTSVVVRELFAHARDSVLVAGYAVYQGRRVFRALAERMEAHPTLTVRLILDIQRSPGDSSAVQEVVRRFADRFRTQQWPKDHRVPQVFFDPRSLESEPQKKASMHAKCVVTDLERVFVSSANFTEAAQERNMEVGLLIRSATLAARIRHHFDALIADGSLLPLFA